MRIVVLRNWIRQDQTWHRHSADQLFGTSAGSRCHIIRHSDFVILSSFVIRASYFIDRGHAHNLNHESRPTRRL